MEFGFFIRICHGIELEMIFPVDQVHGPCRTEKKTIFIKTQKKGAKFYRYFFRLCRIRWTRVESTRIFYCSSECGYKLLLCVL